MKELNKGQIYISGTLRGPFRTLNITYDEDCFAKVVKNI